MDYFFRFAHPWVAIISIITIVIIAFIRYKFHRPILYRYSLTSELKKSNYSISRAHHHIPFLLKLLALLSLGLLVARPQLVNVHSKVHVEGHDIMLVLDASGSMQCFDDIQDQRPRFTVAKQEAIRFIEKRDNDQIGLVIFGRDAVSRCPLTLDKKILKSIIEDLNLGDDINPDGTVLSIAISMAANRLKKSKAKNKLLIVLTDGEPTPGIDIQPTIAIDLAKKLGIKIYTIGVGGEHGGLWHDPLFGIRSMGFKMNKQLLEIMAQQTGGQFFAAQNPDDIARIYDTIDTLEKTEIETNVFSNYYDLVFPFIMAIILLLLSELMLTTFVWFRL